jgi:hypothetical protein
MSSTRKPTPQRKWNPSTLEPGVRLLLRVARAADAIARQMQLRHHTHASDVRVWVRAERKVLGRAATVLAHSFNGCP